MGLTTIEKIFARTSGRESFRQGELVVCKPDVVIQLELVLAIEGGWYRPKAVFDPERVVMVFDQAFIGSCANGLIEDLRVAADIVRGRKVAPGVRFIVTPASQRVFLQASREGLIEALVEAGAVVTNSTCGACYGQSMGVLGPGEVCITASTRNFKGRMGSAQAQIYMGSPATVAASALTGTITDPRSLIQKDSLP